MFDFMKKKASSLFVTESPLEDLREQTDDQDRSKQAGVTGTIIQTEKVLGFYSGVTRDVFHILMKVDSSCEYADSEGYLVIQETNEKRVIPLAKEGDKVTIIYWTKMSQLNVANFVIDFSARKAEVE